MTEDKKNLQAEVTASNRSPEEAFISGSEGERVKIRRLKHAPGQTGRRRSPVNAVDIILIVMILAAIALAVMLAFFRGVLFGGKTETRIIEYTVVFKQVDETFATSIVNGDPVLNVAGKQSAGIVSADVESSASTYVAYHAAAEEGLNGSAVLMTYPDRMDLTVTIRVEAEYTPGSGYSVGGLRIAVGSEYSLMFPGYTGTGTCIALNDTIS